MTDAVYRDVIRATETEDGALTFVETPERSPLVTNSWTLSQELVQSEAVPSGLKQIRDQGGNWEQAAIPAAGSAIRSQPCVAVSLRPGEISISFSLPHDPQKNLA